MKAHYVPGAWIFIESHWIFTRIHEVGSIILIFKWGSWGTDSNFPSVTGLKSSVVRILKDSLHPESKLLSLSCLLYAQMYMSCLFFSQLPKWKPCPGKQGLDAKYNCKCQQLSYILYPLYSIRKCNRKKSPLKITAKL